MRKDQKCSLAASDPMPPGCIFVFLSAERKVEAAEQPTPPASVC